ncbi:MAG: hypothetical protein H7X97_05245 [Opitutaceae bacterium]|nr:hypothetical protein [Verrucomicrobiales bacterium]
MTRPFILSVLAFSLGHYLALHLLEGLIFLIAHVPPGAINLDPVIVALSWLGKVLVGPRLLLRHLWFSEVTPGWLTVSLTVANSLIWGIALAATYRWWRHR